MKVNFEYYGEAHRLKVTKELIHKQLNKYFGK
jgi:hypothetical protein